jgi:hypothetical protein
MLFATAPWKQPHTQRRTYDYAHTQYQRSASRERRDASTGLSVSVIILSICSLESNPGVGTFCSPSTFPQVCLSHLLGCCCGRLRSRHEAALRLPRLPYDPTQCSFPQRQESNASIGLSVSVIMLPYLLLEVNFRCLCPPLPLYFPTGLSVSPAGLLLRPPDEPWLRLIASRSSISSRSSCWIVCFDCAWSARVYLHARQCAPQDSDKKERAQHISSSCWIVCFDCGRRACTCMQ